MGFYDDDMNFLANLAERLGVKDDKAWQNKLRRVVRRMVKYRVLSSHMSGTQKEYLGEPAKTMIYAMPVQWCARLAPEMHPGYTPMGNPEWEAGFILRHAYPKED